MDIKIFYDIVCYGILANFSDREVRMAGLNRHEIEDMVTCVENEYKEWVPRYEQFEKTLEDYYQDNDTRENANLAVEELTPICRQLVTAQLGAM